MFILKNFCLVQNSPNSQKWSKMVFIKVNSMGWPIYQVKPGSCYFYFSIWIPCNYLINFVLHLRQDKYKQFNQYCEYLLFLCNPFFSIFVGKYVFSLLKNHLFKLMKLSREVIWNKQQINICWTTFVTERGGGWGGTG